MKNIFVLFLIGSLILFAAGCQKDDLPQVNNAALNSCSVYKQTVNGNIKGGQIIADKKLQNAVACKACHVNKDCGSL